MLRRFSRQVLPAAVLCVLALAGTLAPVAEWGFHAGRWDGYNTLKHKRASGLRLTYGPVERLVGVARP